MVARRVKHIQSTAPVSEVFDFKPAGAGHNGGPPLSVDMPGPLIPMLFGKARYKVAYGGRGAGKSWAFARALVIRMLSEKHLVLCTREFQNSIADSVHRLIVAQITALKIQPFYMIEKSRIVCKTTGSEIIFKGIRHHAEEIKSTEGVTICWLAEAQATSLNSWQVLDPTIRTENAEIWIDFNPDQADDPIYDLFIVKKQPNSIVVKVDWKDNAWFPKELNKIRLHAMRTDPDAYDWIWEGQVRKITEAAIFRGRYVIEPFDTPEDIDRLFMGADWGFANDPTVLLRFFIKDSILYVDHEAYGVGIEIDDLPTFFRGGLSEKTGAIYVGVPGADQWPIFADSARPETISYVRNRGFNINPAKKWKGCVEDGIEHIKGYKRIVIHPRCTYMAQEARLYSYKLDAKTKVVLPLVEDKHNHCWDAIRYGLDGHIQDAGGLGVWAKLA